MSPQKRLKLGSIQVSGEEVELCNLDNSYKIKIAKKTTYCLKMKFDLT